MLPVPTCPLPLMATTTTRVLLASRPTPLSRPLEAPRNETFGILAAREAPRPLRSLLELPCSTTSASASSASGEPPAASVPTERPAPVHVAETHRHDHSAHQADAQHPEQPQQQRLPCIAGFRTGLRSLFVHDLLQPLARLHPRPARRSEKLPWEDYPHLDELPRRHVACDESGGDPVRAEARLPAHRGGMPEDLYLSLPGVCGEDNGRIERTEGLLPLIAPGLPV